MRFISFIVLLFCMAFPYKATAQFICATPKNVSENERSKKSDFRISLRPDGRAFLTEQESIKPNLYLFGTWEMSAPDQIKMSLQEADGSNWYASGSFSNLGGSPIFRSLALNLRRKNEPFFRLLCSITELY